MDSFLFPYAAALTTVVFSFSMVHGWDARFSFDVSPVEPGHVLETLGFADDLQGNTILTTRVEIDGIRYPVVAKLDSLGRLGTMYRGSTAASSLDFDPLGGLVLRTYDSSSETGEIIRYRPTESGFVPDFGWDTSYNPRSSTRLHLTPHGFLFIDPEPGAGQVAYARFDYEGALLWSRLITITDTTGGDSSVSFSIQITRWQPDGSLVFIGKIEGSDNEEEDTHLFFRLDPNGDVFDIDPGENELTALGLTASAEFSPVLRATTTPDGHLLGRYPPREDEDTKVFFMRNDLSWGSVFSIGELNANKGIFGSGDTIVIVDEVTADTDAIAARGRSRSRLLATKDGEDDREHSSWSLAIARAISEEFRWAKDLDLEQFPELRKYETLLFTLAHGPGMERSLTSNAVLRDGNVEVAMTHQQAEGGLEYADTDVLSFYAITTDASPEWAAELSRKRRVGVQFEGISFASFPIVSLRSHGMVATQKSGESSQRVYSGKTLTPPLTQSFPTSVDVLPQTQTVELPEEALRVKKGYAVTSEGYDILLANWVQEKETPEDIEVEPLQIYNKRTEVERHDTTIRKDENGHLFLKFVLNMEQPYGATVGIVADGIALESGQSEPVDIPAGPMEIEVGPVTVPPSTRGVYSKIIW